MAILFDTQQRIVPTWLAAARHMADVEEGSNLLLEISDPMAESADDLTTIASVDGALRLHADSSVSTVAGTIFPAQYARKHPRPGLYDSFVDMMEKRGKKKGTWGTYAMRMMRRAGKKKDENFYPLETIIEKLMRASAGGHPYKAAYELGVLEPNEDIFPFELQTYDGKIDAGKISNMPCLSHVSFKMVDRTHVTLTAMYRSHYYCSKALGNLLGLRDLLAFVAKESELQIGSLTCLSTFARFDDKAWGGPAAAKALLAAALPAPTANP